MNDILSEFSLWEIIVMGFEFGSFWTLTVFSLRKAWRNILGRRLNNCIF